MANRKISKKSKFIGYKLKFIEFLKKKFYPVTLYHYLINRYKLKKQISKIQSIIENNDELVDVLIANGFWVEKGMVLHNIQAFKLNPNFNENMNIKNMIENININVSQIFNKQFKHLELGYEYHIERDTDYQTYHTIVMKPHHKLDVEKYSSLLKKSSIYSSIFIIIFSLFLYFYKPFMQLFV